MKGKLFRKITACTLAAAMLATAAPNTGFEGLFSGIFKEAAAVQDPVSYLKYSWSETDGLTSEEVTAYSYTEVGSYIMVLNPDGLMSGTYVVKNDTTIPRYVYIRKDQTVNLVIPEGVTLTCEKGIGCGLDKNGSHANLNIYGTGTLIANGIENTAGIGGKDDEANGNITIHGTTVKATGGKHGAGIGGGEGGKDPDGSTSIKIYAGDVTAKGGIDGAGIGGGDEQPGAHTYIYGGTVTASSEKHGAGIGGGDEEGTLGVFIYGGKVTATGGEHGAGIGAGEEGGNMRKSSDGGGINILGGDVTATGGKGGAGIGGGYNEDMSGTVDISGYFTKLTVAGGESAAGIGAGNGNVDVNCEGDMDGTVTINCGAESDIKIVGGSKYKFDENCGMTYTYGGAGIGAGYAGNMTGKVYIKGGNISVKSGGLAAGIGGGMESNATHQGGEGGNVYIAGGNLSISFTPDASKVEHNEAIGAGYDDSVSGSVYITPDKTDGEYMKVDRLDGKTWKTVKASDRTSYCHKHNEVKISVCDHQDVNGNSGLTYTIDGDKHTKKCKYCGLSIKEEHTGADCECGYTSDICTVTLITPAGNEYASVARNKNFDLPGEEGEVYALNTVPVLYERVTGWHLTGDTSTVYQPGDTITVTGDMSFTEDSEDVYSIGLESENCKISTDKTEDGITYAAAGETVQILIEPKQGYSIDSVSYKVMIGYDIDGKGNPVLIYGDPVAITANEDGEYLLTPPAYTTPNNSIIVSAVCTKDPEQQVIVEEGILYGTVTSDKATADAGSTVTLTVTPDKGYRLSKLNCEAFTFDSDDVTEITPTKVSDTVYQFEMPVGNAYVNAEFEENTDNRISGASLSLGGEIAVNLYLSLDDEMKADEEAYITMLGPDDDEAVKVLVSELAKSGDLYIMSYKVNAAQMGEKIAFTLYNGQNEIIPVWNTVGTQSYETYTYSVMDYIKAVKPLKDEDDNPTELAVLAEKMQTYGALARMYLIDTGKVSENTAYVEPSAVTYYDAGALVDYKLIKSSELTRSLSVSLVLESETSLRLYYSGEKTDVSVYDKDTNQDVAYRTGKKGGKYYIEIPNIAAPDLDRTFMIVFADEGMVFFSALSFAELILGAYQNNNDKNVVCDMVRALYDYNQAANDYFD